MRLCALLALLLAPAAASAQVLWRAAPGGPTVSVDALVALGDDYESAFTSPEGRPLDGSVGVVSSAVTLTARVPVGAGVSVVADLPFSYSRFSTPDVPALGIEAGAEGDVDFGNPYLGAEAQVRPDLALGAGVRLPLTSDYRDDGTVDPAEFGWQGGLVADRERFEAYLSDVLTVSALARYEPVRGPARLRLLLVPTYLADFSSETFFGDPNPPRTGLALGYGAQAEVETGPVAVSGGVVGRPVLTGERFELFSADAALTAGLRAVAGPVRPGLLVRVPLDRDRFAFESDATVGFSLDVPLR